MPSSLFRKVIDIIFSGVPIPTTIILSVTVLVSTLNIVTRRGM